MVEGEKVDRCRERPKDGYIRLRPIEMIRDAWAAEEKIIPRYAYRLLQALRLMVESRDAAENTRRKKRREGRKVAVKQEPTYRLEEAQKITGLHLKDLAKAKALLLKCGLLHEWSDHAIRFATGIDDLNLEYLQEQFPDFAEKRARYEEKLEPRAVHPKRLYVNVRFPRKFLRAIARGHECEWSRSAVLLDAGIRCLFIKKGTNLINPVGRLDLNTTSLLFGRCTKSLKAALKEVSEDWHALEVLGDGRVAVNLDWDGIPVDTTPAEDAETEINAADLPQCTRAEDKTSSDRAEKSDKISTPSILYNHSPLQELSNHHSPASGKAADGDLKIKKGKGAKSSRHLFTITHRKQLVTLGFLYEIFLKLVGAGYFHPTKPHFVKLVGFALRAYELYLHEKTRNAGGLFYTWVTNREEWDYRISQELEDQAEWRVDEYIERIETEKRKPPAPPPPPPPVQQSTPDLSQDAAIVQAVMKACAFSESAYVPFTELKRRRPAWTRERWDQATRELEEYQAAKRKSPIGTVGEMNLLGAGFVDRSHCPSDSDFEADVIEQSGLSRGNKFGVVKENGRGPVFAEGDRQGQDQHAKSRCVQKHKRQRLEFARRGLEKDRWFAAHVICERLITDSPLLVDEAVEVLLREDADFESLYQAAKSPLANYQGSPFLRTLVDKHLEQKHPEHFQSIRDKYDSCLNEMNVRLAA